VISFVAVMKCSCFEFDTYGIDSEREELNYDKTL